MDLSMLLTVVLLSMFVLSAFFSLKSQASPKEMEQIPGSMGWPIVGESFSFLSNFSSPYGIYNFMKTRQQRYGKVFKSSVSGDSLFLTVFMTGREASKILLTGKDGMVSLNLFYTGMQVLGPTNLLQTTGEMHKRLIAEPLSLDGLKNYFQFINMLAIQTLDQWPGRTVFVLEEASTFTLKVIGNMIMSLEPTGEEQEKFRANFKIISSSFASLPFKIPRTAFIAAFSLMKIKSMPETMHQKFCSFKCKEIEVLHFLESLIMKHSKAADGGDDENKLTDTQLKDNILTLLVAGHDTTTAALTWIMKFLGENPLSNRKDGEYLTWSELNKMPYTTKKGWSVNLDVVSIHHDPEVFPDPEKFDPSRFDEPLKPFSFLGFGRGPRMCPGINLAKLEISIFIHYLVCRYKWRALEKDDSGQPTLVRMPKNKYPIVVESL
ncbi:hypothetical protein ACB094_01G115500 [Castanea mollissima]